MSQQESTNVNPSGDTFSKSIHEISRLERDGYYNGVSGRRRSGPKLVYRTSTDVFRNRVVVGPFTYICAMQLLPVYGHDKLSKLWNAILEETVNLLDKQEIKFTSIDLARFRWKENDDRVPVTVTSRVTIWIGVLPGSTTTEAAFHASQGILELLKQHEIDDLDVAFRESVVRPLALNDFDDVEKIFYQHSRSSFELFAPVREGHHLQNVIDWATTSLSLPIAGLKTLHIQGSLGFYFRVGSDLYGVTARHILFPEEEGNMPYKHVAPAPEREVVLMSERAYEDFLTSIRHKKRVLTYDVDIKQRQATEERAQAETGDEQAAIALANTEAKIERLNEAFEALDVFLTTMEGSRWSFADLRVIGHVVWAPPISGNNPPYGYTQDLCVIKLDKSKFAANFRGNVIHLGGDNLSDTIQFWMRFHPRHDAPFEFPMSPIDRLYKLQRVLTPAQLKQPKTQDSEGDPVRFVFQKGHTSGLTIGPLNGFESHVRRYSLLGSFDSVEAAVYAYDNESGSFSQCGDSGTVIAGDEQEFGLQLTSGAGSGNIELTDITYCTPMFWLWNHVIKAEFPGAELYFDAI
ncbi:hypothetical protein DFP72DRAFT_1174346 [Ephemerocybe angulata]|uniref:Uncharacterized protein n=1 Tax=Ephemerocybe angulata TaxID=980116 RepID=A0A8H6M1Q6_9AGAR|nr:hypothetical protein DFP72DRAFT_1174346 [Tulosesus angulatus]